MNSIMWQNNMEEPKFYDSIDVIDEKAYSVSGLKSEVDQATATLNVIGEVIAGNFSTKYLLDSTSVDSEITISRGNYTWIYLIMLL